MKIKLYKRCRDFNSFHLPSEGGILDQEERLMQVFDIIHSAYVKFENEESEDRIRKFEQRMRVQALKGNPGIGF